MSSNGKIKKTSKCRCGESASLHAYAENGVQTVFENENGVLSGRPGRCLGSNGCNRFRAARGFGAMSKEKQQAIASKGGKASHALGTGHEWTSETARAAGRRGGKASRGGRGKLPEVKPEQKSA